MGLSTFSVAWIEGWVRWRRELWWRNRRRLCRFGLVWSLIFLSRRCYRWRWWTCSLRLCLGISFGRWRRWWLWWSCFWRGLFNLYDCSWCRDVWFLPAWCWGCWGWSRGWVVHWYLGLVGIVNVFWRRRCCRLVWWWERGSMVIFRYPLFME